MTTMQPTSWREERRRDRAAEAQIARDDAAMQAKLRLAEDQAARAERRAARKQRAARWDALTAWVRGHVTDLLFVPVISVPGTLAWSAMAAYGADLFGPIGYALPAFSEGAMWAFEARATWTARQHAGRPVWHLQAGSLFFAGVGAALNFLHGVTPIPGHPHGVVVGTVMAIISAAGLVAHQIVNLGPRRTRADRQAAKLQRAAERRAQAVSRAALNRSAATVDASGNARILFRPGTFTLGRHHGRARLGEVASEIVWLPWPMMLPGATAPAAIEAADMQAAEAVAAYRGWHSEFVAVPDPRVRQITAAPPPRERQWPRPAPALTPPPVRQTAVPPPPVLAHAASVRTAAAEPHRESAKPRPAAAPKPAAAKRQKTASTPSGKRAAAVKLLTANPAMPRAEVMAQTGVSARTADRIRAEIPRRLHVAGG